MPAPNSQINPAQTEVCQFTPQQVKHLRKLVNARIRFARHFINTFKTQMGGFDPKAVEPRTKRNYCAFEKELPQLRQLLKDLK